MAGDLYGGALGHWILWTTIVTHSKLKGESKKEVWAKLEFSALALLSNAFATYLLKFGVGRERPNNGALSFPSGHTSHSFTIAAVTNELYGWKAGTVAYLMQLCQQLVEFMIKNIMLVMLFSEQD